MSETVENALFCNVTRILQKFLYVPDFQNLVITRTCEWSGPKIGWSGVERGAGIVENDKSGSGAGGCRAGTEQGSG